MFSSMGRENAILGEQKCIADYYRLWGNPPHLEYLRASLEERHGKDELRIVVASRNSDTYTYDGIEVGAERVAQEVEEEINSLEKDGIHIRKLSVVGYSLGGLIARYTIGLLYSRGWFDKLEPMNFTTFASPHLGVRAPLRGYHTTAWNFLGARTLSTSGRQLFLIDSFRDEGRPLLSVLADPSSIFIKALSHFKRRTLYANIVNDRSAPYYTTFLDKSDPYVDLQAIEMNYLDGFHNVILDPDQPVKLAKPKEELTLYSSILNRSSSLLTQLPLYIMLAVLVPIGSTVFLINCGIQNFRSNQRIRLHEEGKAGAYFKNYRIPLMIENARNAVEEAIGEVNGGEREEYLTESEGSSPKPSIDSANEPDTEKSEEQYPTADLTLTRTKTDPVTGFPILALAPEQFEMIKALDNVGFRKFPIHIHKVRHSHAAIIVRSPKTSFEEGKIVVKHWLDREFEI